MSTQQIDNKNKTDSPTLKKEYPWRNKGSSSMLSFVHRSFFIRGVLTLFCLYKEGKKK